MIKRLESSEVNASLFDGDSIMLYEYPPRWFKNGVSGGTKKNTRLSEKDKKWIANNYPAWSSDIGQFSTLRKYILSLQFYFAAYVRNKAFSKRKVTDNSVRQTEVRSLDTFSSDPVQQDMAFEPSYAQPPRVAVGLSWLDLDYRTDICVKATAEDVSEDHFTVGIIPGTGSNVYSAACSWLEASVNEPDIKMGQWDLNSSTWRSKTKPTGGKTSTFIKFDQRFDGREAPIVVAWFTGLSLGKDSPWRVKTYVTDASPFKFQLHVEAGSETDLRNATVTWLAIPAGKEGITAGFFCTDDIPGPENAGAIDFSPAGFRSAPSMMMAICGIDFECGHNLRLRVSHSSLTRDGMVWHLDSWLDSLMNMATGIYVAVGGPNVDEGY